MSPEMNRREFLSGAAAAATVTILPRRVLGGAGYVAPSDKITLACVGFGTQAIREIGSILASPDVEVVAVCDVDRSGVGYLEWGRNQIRDGIRRLLENPAWRDGVPGVPGVLDVGKEIVDTFYAKFAGGSIADMGHYSLWPIFQMLEPDAPASVESTPTHVCEVKDDICVRIRNDYSFPTACTVRMRFPPKGTRPALDIFWYDGGIKPPVPEEWMAENRELADEGMLFVGDAGRILGGFRSENPQIIPEAKMRAYRAANNIPEPAPPQPRAPRTEQDNRPRVSPRDQVWIDAFKGGPPSYGDFLLAGPICDAVNLAAVSLRLGGRRLAWDAAAAAITNVPEANALLTRDYREGWQL